MYSHAMPHYWFSLLNPKYMSFLHSNATLNFLTLLLPFSFSVSHTHSFSVQFVSWNLAAAKSLTSHCKLISSITMANINTWIQPKPSSIKHFLHQEDEQHKWFIWVPWIQQHKWVWHGHRNFNWDSSADHNHHTHLLLLHQVTCPNCFKEKNFF